MHYHTGWLSVFTVVLVLSGLSAGLACPETQTPFSSPRNEMLVKHKWNAIPENWVSMGQPPNGTMIELHIALKPNRENALIDALHEVSHPRHPKHVLFTGTPPLEAIELTCAASDTARTYRRSRLLSSLRRTPTHSSLYAHGLNTTACRPPPFQ
jgi:hypothetical protein